MKIRKEIKVGVVFVIATAILIWGLMYLKGLELLKKAGLLYEQEGAAWFKSTEHFIQKKQPHIFSYYVK